MGDINPCGKTSEFGDGLGGKARLLCYLGIGNREQHNGNGSDNAADVQFQFTKTEALKQCECASCQGNGTQRYV